MKIISGGVCAAKGFQASGVHCGIRASRTKRDLALIYSSVPASAAAVYTTNLVKGAPLTVTKQHISDGVAQAVICNSGPDGPDPGDSGPGRGGGLHRRHRAAPGHRAHRGGRGASESRSVR